jgi:hypothetical protein
MKVKVQQNSEEINLFGGLFYCLEILKKVDFMRMTKIKTGKIKRPGILKTIAGLVAFRYVQDQEMFSVIQFKKFVLLNSFKSVLDTSWALSRGYLLSSNLISKEVLIL